jgi:hypothetical protein
MTEAFWLVLIQRSRTHALLDVLRKSFIGLNACQSTEADPQERESVRKENAKEEIKAKVILEKTRVQIA